MVPPMSTPTPMSLCLRDYLPLCALVQHEACGDGDLPMGGCQLPDELPQPPPHHPGSPGEWAGGSWGGWEAWEHTPRYQETSHTMISGPHIIENCARYSTGH